MDFLQTVLEYLASAARALWPGVLAATGAGYLGSSVLGFWGFVVGAGIGAMVGTWAGAQLGLTPIRRTTGNANSDMLVQSFGAFVIAGVGYMLMQVIAFVLVIVALVLAAAYFLG